MTIELVEDNEVMKNHIYSKFTEMKDFVVFKMAKGKKDYSIYIYYPSDVVLKIGAIIEVRIYRVDFCDELEEIYIQKSYMGGWGIVAILDYDGIDVMQSKRYPFFNYSVQPKKGYHQYTK